MAAPGSRRARAQKRRVRRVAAADNDLTPTEWAAIREAWAGCAYCGVTDAPLQRDCVLPISRGGRYTVENVVPACRSCNASKSNDEVTSWMRRRRMDEPAFLTRWVTIGRAMRDAAAQTDLVSQVELVSRVELVETNPSAGSGSGS